MVYGRQFVDLSAHSYSHPPHFGRPDSSLVDIGSLGPSRGAPRQGTRRLGMRILGKLGALAGALVLLVPSMALAQASITGNVKDSAGARLPGVTVGAASPVLIEKTRTVVTDSNGRYQIIDLRPGTYTVTFTLTGFNTF